MHIDILYSTNSHPMIVQYLVPCRNLRLNSLDYLVIIHATFSHALTLSYTQL